jgi:lysine 2,3-aminomutase
MKKHYPGSTISNWLNWRWQLKNSITSAEKLSRIITLSWEEKEAFKNSKTAILPLRITPYYASLLDPDNPLHPLRRSVVPVLNEFCPDEAESEDPLGEDSQSPVPGLVHRYPDRVLFLSTNFCATYCRYCTRSRVIENRAQYKLNIESWNAALAYIAGKNEIRDVLISGGDPLTMPDIQLKYLLAELRAIKHVEIIRIGTKVPVVMPQRITSDLLNIIKKYKPVWINIHFTHPDEITTESAQAIERLADAGIPLGSQTVLLKGINDDSQVLKSLFHKLLQLRVRPYYLYQCDRISGSSHFVTPVEKGIEMIEALRGHTTGFAVPQFVIDAPNGGGKIPILPDYFLGFSGGYANLRNYQNKLFKYRNETGDN